MAAKGVLVFFAMFLVVQIVAGMDLNITNAMNQPVEVICGFGGRTPGDFGTHILQLGMTYSFPMGRTDLPNISYMCGVSTVGKPPTNLNVFIGTGGTKNIPCNCTGSTCKWNITEAGILCNDYSHGWGQRM